MLGSMLEAPEHRVGLTLTSHVDDLVADTERECPELMCAVANQFAAIVGAELGGDIALEKAAVVASSPALTSAIRG